MENKMGSYNLMFALGEDKTVWLPYEDAKLVYDAFVPVLAEHLGEGYEENAEIDFDMMKYVSFVDLSADNFNLAYELIMDVDSLNPALKNDIKQAFEADERFKAEETA